MHLISSLVTPLNESERSWDEESVDIVPHLLRGGGVGGGNIEPFRDAIVSYEPSEGIDAWYKVKK
jgi:hypothetical protein